MKKILFNFLRCGLLGIYLEIAFTAYHSYRKKDYRLSGNTSLWMFPIYGSAVMIKPVGDMMKAKHHCFFYRGVVYMLLIYIVEYTSGTMLRKHNLCPWDYSDSKWNINSVIRFDYAPLWFATGLLYELLLSDRIS